MQKLGKQRILLSPENVKRIGPNQTKEVEKLTLKNTEYLFGETTVEAQLEQNHISLGIYNEDALSGVCCLNCYPNIPALPQCDWEEWLYNMYNLQHIVPMTSLWIHYAVWDRRYTTLFLKPILQHLFQVYEPLEHVLMMCPPGVQQLDFIDPYARRQFPDPENQKTQSLFIAKKYDFTANYVIRRAVEEDNDDLVAIIPGILKETYGQYYISEILSNEEMQRQIVVAELRGSAVGVLCINENINYDLLNEQFELVPYNGFKKSNEADEIVEIHTSASILPTNDESAERLCSIVLSSTESKEEEEKKPGEEDDDDDEFSLVNLSSSLLLNFLYDDDHSDILGSSGSSLSIESHLSAVVLNEDYQDHLYYADRGGDDNDDRKLKHKDSKMEDETIPVFCGEPNAFALEICTAIPEHENCLFLLFQAAFHCFPDRDYIILSLPADAKTCYLTKHFTRVIPRANSVFEHQVYVLHKSAILGRLAVREAVPQDVRHINHCIKSLVQPSIVEEMFKQAVAMAESPLRAFTFLCERQVVGCAILSEETDHEYLQLHYDIDSWAKPSATTFGNWGNLEHFLLTPIFHMNTRFFLRELHRLSYFHALFYRFKNFDYLYNHKNPPTPIVNSLNHMLPVLPCVSPQYSSIILTEFQLPECLHQQLQPFGLYISTMRLLSMSRVIINHRIVVVGAGATAIAFLESLLFSGNKPHQLVFTNLTMVSPHGVAYHKPPSAIREMIFVRDGRLDRKYMDQICLRTYVHVITGVVTGINRKKKSVILNDDSHIPYDYMFLMCGEQFQKPPMKKKEVVKKKQDFPLNVFIINTEADAGNCFNTLRHLKIGQKQTTIVVFGHFLEALCCLATLLEFGVPGNNLVFVDPSPDNSSGDHHDHLTQFFNNPVVENAIMEEVARQGITIYQDFNFVDWHNTSKNLIKSAKFESKYKFVEIELSALFIYHAKGVSTKTFQAIVKSGLVFNGRLIIDHNCQTNDPNIYGAGPLTMYSKRYYAEHLMHKYFNAQEIGSKLGYEIRKKLVPDLPASEEEPVKHHLPVVQHCQFPGNLHYLQVSNPGQPVPLDIAMIKCNYGRVLITGDCKKLQDKGYFRLHLNQFQTVETITCLAKFELHIHNLIALWGKHEVLLNHLVLRYDLNMITNLFDYFNQPWAAAIYHRNFPRLYDQIYDVMKNVTSKEGLRLIDEVKLKLETNNWNPLNSLQIDEVEEICRDSKLVPVMEKMVMDFLHDNYSYLPMYAHQLLIRWIKHEIKTSPLYSKVEFSSEVEEEVPDPTVIRQIVRESKTQKEEEELSREVEEEVPDLSIIREIVRKSQREEEEGGKVWLSNHSIEEKEYSL